MSVFAAASLLLVVGLVLVWGLMSVLGAWVDGDAQDGNTQTGS
jgi:hypothetical protein